MLSPLSTTFLSMLETGFEHSERLFEIGDVVVVAGTVPG
jgi:hypothetical protein